MEFSSPAVIYRVADVPASARFAAEHLGFTIAAETAAFTAMSHRDLEVRIIFTRPGPVDAPASSEAVQLGLLVSDIHAHLARLEGAVELVAPLSSVTLGDVEEHSFQIADSNGVTYRFVEMTSR